MMRPLNWRRCVGWLLLGGVLAGTAGCGSFMARRLVQAPNTYPQWFDFEAPVRLGFSPRFLTNFPREYVTVGPPTARLCYRVIEPADYALRERSTNWWAHGRREYQFSFTARLPAPTNAWSVRPRGTVILLHGYGLAQFSLAPWALRLAQEGWRCVLVDLRGHGRSTGKRVYYGLVETNDLSQLLDALAGSGRLAKPVGVVGESYGAALALRWELTEPRLGPVVSIAPYASLSNAVMNIRRDYLGWLPSPIVRAGLRRLPGLIQAPPGSLDPERVLAGQRVRAMFVAGGADDIAPVKEVERLRHEAGPGSPLVVVPEATHESLAYFFDDLAGPVADWLAQAGGREEGK